MGTQIPIIQPRVVVRIKCENIGESSRMPESQWARGTPILLKSLKLSWEFKERLC